MFFVFFCVFCDKKDHNFLHAFSVAHVCYLLLSETSMIEHVSPLDVLVIFCSSLFHDMEHPGTTNAFQINTESELALRYNDKSVLENHHAHVAAMILKNPKTNVFSEMQPEQRKEARKSLITLILHTDMSFHQDIVSKLQNISDDLKQKQTNHKDMNAEHHKVIFKKNFVCVCVCVCVLFCILFCNVIAVTYIQCDLYLCT